MNAPSLAEAPSLAGTATIPPASPSPVPRRSHPRVSRGSASPSASIPGLADLWRITKGDPRIAIAVIDGPVDTSHPCFAGASLETVFLKGQAAGVCRSKSQGSCNHGTQIASLLFAQHGCGPVLGVAPKCRGLIIPVFRDHPLVAGGVLPASQTDLARAIDLACDRGVQLINISSGQKSLGGHAEPQLEAAVRRCAERGILIVSAAGNEGCDCLHVPAALPGVLVVGALDVAGRPAGFSNYGDLYRSRGVLAPGEQLPVASTGGGFEVQSGTSFATPLVTGIAALLLSIRSVNGKVRSLELRDLLLKSARGCAGRSSPACRRFLTGTLDVKRALMLLGRGDPPMNTPDEQDPTDQELSKTSPDGQELADASQQESGAATGRQHGAAAAAARRVGQHSAAILQNGEGRPRAAAPGRSQVLPSCKGDGEGKEGCSCGGGGGKCGCGGEGGGERERPPLVYALGTLSYDFGTQARFDSLASEIAAVEGAPPAPLGPIPASIDTAALLAHLAANPYVAESITWTLNLDATPIYAIRPNGAFAAQTYDRLRQFLSDQVDAKVRAERVALPGYVVGTQTLLTGQKVGVVVPELRGMFNWTTGALVERARGKPPGDNAPKGDQDAYRRREEGLTNFLNRVYHEVRNVGLESRDRALNFAATNAFQIERLFSQAAASGLQLDQIDVERSPVCRLDSDCWDVVLYFFNPGNVLGEARRAYRFTVDVSDVVPVLIGDIREWAVR